MGNGIGFMKIHAMGFEQEGLPPDGRGGIPIAFFGQFIQYHDRQGFSKTIFRPFIIIEFYKSANRGLLKEIITGKGTVHYGPEYLVHKLLFGRNRKSVRADRIIWKIGPKGKGRLAHHAMAGRKQQEDQYLSHAPMIGKITLKR